MEFIDMQDPRIVESQRIWRDIVETFDSDEEIMACLMSYLGTALFVTKLTPDEFMAMFNRQYDKYKLVAQQMVAKLEDGQ